MRRDVEVHLEWFLEGKAREAAESGMPAEIAGVLRDFGFAGGKRIRPVLCVAGWQAAGGGGPYGAVMEVAASLGMFHAFCLVHDDVIDDSAARRGQPTVHRALAARCASGRSPAAARRQGVCAAVLVGDLALAWSDELLHSAGLTPRQFTDALPVIDIMRTEVLHGQYLDVTATGQPSGDVERALAIGRCKTAKYTVERPLHIGAALAGDDDTDGRLRTALSEFAIPLGEAFQFRDDLLRVFGDPATTGKSALDDLRDGKPTVLAALALQRATPAQAEQLRLLLGCPTLTDEQADAARRVITATGARDAVEHMITRRYEQAVGALDRAPVDAAAAVALRRLADLAVRRST
ncbi:polyprenyl synthetase family protein [Streptomyces sp. NPDC088789]|uniref:polyprenyl synthetase family protein n=1 Tax=Streptomyces sp. NPDC088789 TaxID=3365899 RepID=UPI003807FF2E